MSRPLLSWIMGSYNRPNRMRTCLASILDQEPYGDFEIIVTDNSDNPVAIEQIKELCKMDSRIHYEFTGELAFDPRVGIRSLYDAAEIGFKMSTGEFVCWPNDDPYVCPWFAQRMLGRAAEGNFDIVLCNFINGRHDIPHYPLNTAPVSCSVDKTSFIMRREWMPEEWPGKVTRYGIADGDLVVDIVGRGAKYGKVDHFLVVHN
jgi:glycosyltransferase involved in cell wall biosynthesis